MSLVLFSFLIPLPVIPTICAKIYGLEELEVSERIVFEVTRTNRLLECTSSCTREWDVETQSWGPLKRPVEDWEEAIDWEDENGPFWTDSFEEALRILKRRLSLIK